MYSGENMIFSFLIGSLVGALVVWIASEPIPQTVYTQIVPDKTIIDSLVITNKATGTEIGKAYILTTNGVISDTLNLIYGGR